MRPAVRVVAVPDRLPLQRAHLPQRFEVSGVAVEPQPLFILREATYEDWRAYGGRETREALHVQGLRYFYFYTTD